MFNSAAIKEAIRKAVAALIGFVLALILLAALLLTGMYLLVSAATLALAPHVGPAAALAIPGLGCLLLVALFFYRMVRSAHTPSADQDAPGDKSRASGSPLHSLRSAIKNNPLEAAAVAFAAGMVNHSDSRLRQLLLQGGMELMQKSGASQAPSAQSARPEKESLL